APIGNLTALVSFEIPAGAAASYPDKLVHAALFSLAMRERVPDTEKLALVPFKLRDMAGFRVVDVVPGRAIQLTDGPSDAIETATQPHLIIGVAPGGPQQPGDRDLFARQAFTGLPPLR